MAKALVIVESPAKARTISRYLGSGYVVESSIGHIRDLPSTAAEIPPEYKDESWARLGVNVNEGFEPLYVIPRGKKTQVTKLRSKLKGAERLLLATDEDREGEAIAWHLFEVLRPKVPVSRMVFDEITKAAIDRAIHNTRDIDNKLVSAQEARRVLDRLFGYEVSPVLWRKVRPKLSAGRVQSVATRLVVDRERARMRFKTADYWDVTARINKSNGKRETFEARLIELGGKRVATGKDFADTTGKLKDETAVVLLSERIAVDVAARLSPSLFTIAEVSEKPFTSRPHPPFITSTLQQEAARKLRFTARRTMRTAQSLYENGYITYMRTDSTSLSSEAVNAARKQARELYGDDYVPDAPRAYTRKAKNAQEAHEAIRPAGESFRTPKSLESDLSGDQLKLYELIWKRTVACQMKDAAGKRTTVRATADAGEHGTATFSASGKVITFPGFLRAYVEGSDDPEAELEDQEKILPALTQGEQLSAAEVTPSGHTTQPPARYTEAGLIKELEERGIGRPSTYATIIQTIQDRGYVWKKGPALIPTFTAFAVTALLERFMPDLVDYDFTARMEDGLDAIANGECEPEPWLHDFYYGGTNGKCNGGNIGEVGLKALVNSSGEVIDPREVCSVEIGRTNNGRVVAARVGRYGPYVQINDSDRRATIPDDLPPDELTVPKALELIEQAARADHCLGQDPESGKPVYLKSGRFGPYVQLGDPELTESGTAKRGGKPKMASLWPGMSVESLTLHDALMLLSFPREVGRHPDTGEIITAQEGRFGPYLKMGDESRSLDNHEQLRTITLDQAVERFRQPKGRGRSAKPAVIAELGKHPDTGADIQVKSGRYGPYVTDGVVNATIPRGNDPAAVTLEKALDLLRAREQKLRDQGKDPRAARPKKPKPSASKPTGNKSTKRKKATARARR